MHLCGAEAGSGIHWRGPLSSGAPIPSMPAAAAFSELCGARAGYGMPDLLAARANYKAGHTSLPPTHSRSAEAERLLDGADLEAWVNWEQTLIRSPAELAEARLTEPDPEPFTDYAFVKSPKKYAGIFAELVKRGLIRIGDHQNPTQLACSSSSRATGKHEE